jgi:cytochrome c5
LEPMDGEQVYWVDCRTCHASAGSAKTPQEAADKWNRRTFYGGAK